VIPLVAYTAVSMALLAVGVYGLTLTRNSIKILMCVELILNAANINFAASASYHGNDDGLVFVLFGIAIAAAEAALGIAIFLNLYRVTGTANVTSVSALKG
jgi:NADH-quinone oxidoreductase subunit K